MNASIVDVLRCVFILAAIGVSMWVINTKAPMDPTIKAIINVVVCIAVIVGVLRYFGVF